MDLQEQRIAYTLGLLHIEAIKDDAVFNKNEQRRLAELHQLKMFESDDTTKDLTCQGGL